MFNFPFWHTESRRTAGYIFGVSFKKKNKKKHNLVHTSTDLSKIKACGNTDAVSDLFFVLNACLNILTCDFSFF